MPWAVALCAGLSWGCNGGEGAEEFELTVLIDGDTVTLDWSGEAVHEMRVDGFTPALTGFWIVSTFEDAHIPNIGPTIRPPVIYGRQVEGAFTIFGPEPLEKGVTYEVDLTEWAWGHTCEEHGIAADGSSSECFIRYARKQFTFE